ncbi:protein SPMIP2-like [Styela clava]|uniref:uncharacterized protein C4orf45 homolog n=1 Tax=Styela clava TaxID=7725 RepID=UPI00193ABC77|nr:uncharacterized protein C4orf45 homolog [Styela clava]
MDLPYPSHGLYRTDSGSFDPVTKRYILPLGVNSTGRRMLFTGPDGIRNQWVSVAADHNRYVGIGTMSPEGTSDLDYLYRPSPRDSPALRPKHRRVGEIGWGIPGYADRSVLHTGQQLKRGEFRQSAEDRHTHLYQNPWTPHPDLMRDRPGTAPTRYRGNYADNSPYNARPYSTMEPHRPPYKDAPEQSYESSSHSSLGKYSH